MPGRSAGPDRRFRAAGRRQPRRGSPSLSSKTLVFVSSGDVVADRRYEYGVMLGAAGDHAAAADLFAQALELVPGWAAGWFALGTARLAAEDRAGAAEAYRQVLRIDPADRFGAMLKLALIGEAPTPEVAPAAYVRDLFDQYAADFDVALVERLAYSVPWTIADRLERLVPAGDGPAFARALDLGCGTGLAGEALRRRVGWLAGVDLSPAMIAAAGRKGIYDTLATGDLAEALAGEAAGYDPVTAADVLIYLGDLAPVFAGVARVLDPGGIFAFSVQLHAGEPGGPGWVLGEDMRYHHSRRYLESLAAANGLAARLVEDAVCRCDRGLPVDGLVVFLEKPATLGRPAHDPADGAEIDDGLLPN